MTRARAVLSWLVVAAVFGAGLLAGTRPTPDRGPAWQRAGELARPRAHATALSLATGDILVFGGLDPADPEIVNASTELFDPATGRVSVLSSDLPGRVNHAATIGAGGRVYVTGGTLWSGSDWYATPRLDVYDPYTRQWTQGGALREPRSDHGATLLHDGRIFITGGHDGPRFVRSSEIYDPGTRRWSAAAPLPRPRSQFTIATLPDGRVLVAGGIEDRGLPSDTALFYDPARNAWSEAPALSVARVLHAAVQLPDGDVLMIGGQLGASGSTERFDAAAGRWIAAGTLVEPRFIADAVVALDGRVVLAGGLAETGQPRDGFRPIIDAEVWDPATGSWSALPPTPDGRALAALVATPYGVLEVSGSGDEERAASTVERLTFR
ncbi:MAG: Kelch repeat-containing protein [Candidatus Limnocylindria bacterium]